MAVSRLHLRAVIVTHIYLQNDEPHPLAAEMRLDRFMRGHLIDEKGVGAQPNLH